MGMLNKNTLIISLIVVLVIIIALLGGNLVLSKRNQVPQPNTSTKQLPQNNSQQGGPDTPGQPSTPEGGSPGAGAAN